MNLKNIKLIFILSFLMNLTACGIDSPFDTGTTNDKNEANVVVLDPELVPFKTEFLSMAKDVYAIDLNDNFLSLKFGEVEDDETIAVCNIYYTKLYDEAHIIRREIVVNRDYWSVGQVVKNNFMWHELGHCLLFREHRTDEVVFNENQQAPASIMYPNPIAMMAGLGSQFYTDNLEFYMDELFSPNYYGSIFNNDPGSQAIVKSFSIKTSGCEREVHPVSQAESNEE